MAWRETRQGKGLWVAVGSVTQRKEAAELSREAEGLQRTLLQETQLNTWPLLGRTLSLLALVIQLSLGVLFNAWYCQKAVCLMSVCALLTCSSSIWISSRLLWGCVKTTGAFGLV